MLLGHPVPTLQTRHHPPAPTIRTSRHPHRRLSTDWDPRFDVTGPEPSCSIECHSGKPFHDPAEVLADLVVRDPHDPQPPRLQGGVAIVLVRSPVDAVVKLRDKPRGVAVKADLGRKTKSLLDTIADLSKTLRGQH